MRPTVDFAPSPSVVAAVLARTAAVLGIALLALAGTASPASAYKLLGCKYAGSGNVHVVVGSNVPSALVTATSSARANWNAKISDIKFTSNTPPNTTVRRLTVGTANLASTSVIAFVSDDLAGNLCGSSKTWSGNAAYMFWNTNYNVGALGATGQRAAAAHEMGHALGLGHPNVIPGPGCNNVKSVMHTGFAFWSCGWGTEPWPDDVSGVHSIY